MDETANNGAIPPQGSTAPGGVPPVKVTPPATADTVAQRLGAAEQNTTAPVIPQKTNEPVVSEPQAQQAPVFDLSKLTPEQLIGLKQALEAAPLRVVKKGNPIVKLRRIEGKIVMDFANAYQTLVRDEQANANVEKVVIPVKFMTETGKADADWTKLDYKDFMNADQIKCEVVGTRNEPDGYSEGEVESNERPGVMVELRVNTVKTFFTVKLPEGSPVPQVEIEGKIANG